jgi:putative drug exporter of the RND superfamily
MSGLLYRLGHLCARHRLPVFVAWLVLAIGIVAIANSVGEPTSNNLVLNGTGSTQAQDLLDDNLPNQANGSNPVVIEAPTGKVTSGKNKQAIQATAKSLRNAPHVIKAVSPFSSQAENAISKDKRIAYISVVLDLSQGDLNEDQANTIIDAQAPATRAGLTVATGGYLGQEVSKPSTTDSTLIGLAAAVVILLVSFGSAAAMPLPIVTALLAAAVGVSAIGLLGNLIEVPTVGPTLAVMLALGVGIDYSLFIVNRYRAFLDDGVPVDEAIPRASATAGSSVVFAGTTVMIALIALSVAGISLVTTLGFTAAIAVLVAVIAANTLLPAILSLVGERIHKFRLPSVRTRPEGDGPYGWARWAQGIGRRPVLAVIAPVAVLGVLAVPTLNLELGQQDNGEFSKSTTIRQAYDLMARGFGVGYNGPFLIAVDFGSKPAHPDQRKLQQLQQKEQRQQQQAEDAAVQSATQQLIAEGVPEDEAQQEAEQQVAANPPAPTEKQQQQQQKANQEEAFLKTSASDPRLVKLENQISKTKGVEAVSQAKVDKAGSTAVFTVVATTAPSADATVDLVEHLRSTVIPAAVKGTTLTAYVGGQTASYIDLADRIGDKLPLVIGIVILLCFLLFLLAFRSVVISLQAAIMDLLAVGAAYGVLTFVFQDGHGATLLGLSGASPIVSYVPLLMFAILFGLSMDYQVFVLSRIHEHYNETGDHRESVIRGLTLGAKVVATAAAIMICVFTAFVINGNPVVKQFGLGLGVSTLIDATVALIVTPAILLLLGPATWWLPGWLARVLPRIDVEGERGPAAAAPTTASTQHRVS